MIDFKNAPADELKAEFKRIAQESGDDRFGTKKELRYLPQILMNGEQVLSFASGTMDGNTWLIVLTERRVIFLDRGMLYGLRQTVIPIGKINGITGETGMIFGKIAINDGAVVHKIKNVPKGAVLQFTNRLQEVIDGAHVA